MLKDKPYVSVVMSVFNGEKYIRESVESILYQSFSDFEFIIIDDGSTDNTLSILKKYEKKDFRVRLISRENKGLVASLNQAVDLSVGSWIVRMDADDIALKNRIERQLNWVKKTGSDISGSWVIFFGDTKNRIWKGYQSDEAIKVDMLFKCPLVHPTTIIKASLLKQLKYNPAAEKVEDYDLWVRAAMKGVKITNTPEVLLKYRLHKEQMTVIASIYQKEMSAKIRERYFDYFVLDNNLNNYQTAVKAIFGIQNQKSTLIDFDEIYVVFIKYVFQLHAESRKALLDNLFRLSLLNISAAKVWIILNREYGQKNKYIKNLSVYLIKFTPEKLRNLIFNFLKKTFFSRG